MTDLLDLSNYYMKALTVNTADTQGGFLWLGCTGPLVITEDHGARISHTSGGTGAGRGMQITSIYTGTYASTGIDIQGYSTGSNAQDHLAVVQAFGYIQNSSAPGIVYAYYGGGQNSGSGTVANAYGFYHAGFTNTGGGAISNKWAFYATADMSSFAGLTITGGSAAAGRIVKDATLGLTINGQTGASYDFGVYSPGGSTIFRVATGTIDVVFSGGIAITAGTSGAGRLTKDATLGLAVRGATGATNDLTLLNNGGSTVISVPAATLVTVFAGAIAQKSATITYSASMTPDAAAGNLQTITATNGTAFTINAPTNPRTGQRLRIRLRNTSGGALGAITVNAVYKLTGSAWPNPGNGSSRALEIEYDGTNWVESYRSAADVPN